MELVKNKGDAHRRRLANALNYAPRVRPAVKPAAQAPDPRLRKLTMETLDLLKRPDAVPSVVIYSALARAAQSL